MSWPASSGFKQRSWPWLASLLLLNFLLMTYDARDTSTNRRLIHSWLQALFSPVMSFVSGSGSFIENSAQYFSDLRHAATENVELKEKLHTQELELTQTRTAVTENERLKGLLKLKDEGQYKIVPARVIAHDPSGWFESVTINRGRTDEVELSMPVITVDGIVGRVIGTSPWTAQVMLVTDERFGAGAIVARLDGSNAGGSIRGLGERGLLEMRFVPESEKVNPGDVVTTTGQDELYPAGLMIGTVTEIKTSSTTSTRAIYITPSARLGSLNEVAVLLYKPNVPQPDQLLHNSVKKR